MAVDSRKTTKALEINTVDNQQTDQVTPDVLKNVPQIAPTPKFDIQNAQPLKTPPQLATGRYKRPQGDLEADRGGTMQKVDDLQRGPMTNKMVEPDLAHNNPDQQALGSVFAGLGVVDMMRGVETNKEKPKQTGDDFKNLTSGLWDNAMRGLYEPNSVDTTSQFIMKNPHIFGKTNYQTAAVWGTLAEFTATMAVNPLGALPEAFESMSKAGQDRMLFNKITQSPQYGDNIMAMAEHSGRPWQSVHSQGQRELWNIINKGNYFNNLKANLELHQPFRLQGLTTEDVGESLPFPKEDPAFGLKPTVLVKGKEPSIGIDHEDALEKMGMSKDKAVEGKDFQAGFTTPTGEFITREGSKLPPYNLPNGHSEDIPEEKRKQAIEGPQNFKTAEEYVKSKGDVIYHGSGTKFDKFDDGMRGSITGAKSAKGAIWFTDNQRVAKAYSIFAAETGPVKALLDKADVAEKIAQKSGKQSDWDKHDDLLRQAEEMDTYDKSNYRRELSDVKEAVLNKDLDMFTVDAKGKTPQELSDEGDIDSWLNEQIKEAKKQGKDGLIIKNLDDAVGLTNAPATHYAVFKSEGIKLKSELMKEWEEANRLKAVHSALLAPYEVPSPVSPSSLLKKRYDYLNGQADAIRGEHEALRKQIEQDKKRGFSTGRLEQKLDKVGQKYVQIHNQIVELNLGKVRVNEIKEEVGQAKIEDIIKDVQDAQEKANAEGFKKGIAIGKEKGRIEEVQRKSALEVYANYKQKAVEEMNKIAATLQRIKDSTEGLPIEYKEQLDNILKNFDLRKRTGKTIAERESLRKFIEKSRANGDEIKIPQDVLDAAYQTPLNDLTLTQLRDLNNMVGQIYRMGRLKDKLLEVKGLRDLKSVVDEAVKNITGGKGITLVNKFHEDLKKNDPGIFKAMAEAAKKHGSNPREYLISNLMPEVQILFLDNLDNGGILYNKLFQPLHEATNTSMDNIDKANKATNDIFNYKKPSDFNKTIPLGNSKIRIDDAMWVYANSANDVQRAHAQATGVSDKDFEEVEKNLSEEDKMAVRKLWQYYNERFKELADLRYELEGVVTKQEDNYFPIQNLEDVSPEDDMLWENTLRSDYRKGSIDKGMLKTRTGGNKAFKKWNFFGTIGRNIDKVEHYIAFAKAIRNANKIVNHPDLKAAIVNHKDFGEFYYNSLRKWVSDTARGKFLYETDWFSRLGRGTRMNLTSAFLGLNPSPALKQWTGLFYGAEMAGKSATLKMLPKMLLNYKKMSAQIDAESSMMRHASLRQQRELEEMFSDRGFFERTGALTAYHKFQAGMMFLTQQSDLIIRRAVYLGTQQALKDQGITDKKHLINEAERVVRRTQPMGGITYLPDIFRGGEGARQITFLRGHVNKLWNVQTEMVAKMANGKMRMAQVFSQIIMNNILPMLWLAAVTGTGIFAVKKSKEEGGFLGMEVSQMVTGIPLVEDVINDIRSGRKDTNIPMFEYIQMALDAVNAKNTKKHPGQKLKKTLEFAGAATGLPVVGAEKLTGWGKNDEEHYKKTNQGNDDIYR